MARSRRVAAAPVWLFLLGLCAGCPADPAPGSDTGTRDGRGADRTQQDRSIPDRRPDTQQQLVLSGVRIEANPNNVLSCFVTWTTSRPASSQVDFWRTDSEVYRLASPGQGTRHRVLVIGMRERTSYTLVASSRAQDGVTGRTSALRYTTGKVPKHVPRAELLIYDRQRARFGWTLMTVSSGGRQSGHVTMDDDFVPTAVMYDMEGEPVWYSVHALPRVGDTRYVDGHVLAQSMGSIHDPKLAAVEVNLAGDTVWRGPMQPLHAINGHYNHHFEKLPNGNYLALRNLLVRNIIGDEIVELTPEHRVVWRWSSFDHLAPRMDVWEHSGNFDYSHGNSLQFDPVEDVVYYNPRQLSALYKIDRKTGNVLWKLGEGGSFKADPLASYPWFQKPHSVEVQPNGNVMLYDNGLVSRGFSRAVEYRLDEQSMTAHIVWQFTGRAGKTWQTLYWGDADRLDNGNTLITAGTWTTGDRSHIFEVTPDNVRVWEIRLPPGSSAALTLGVYNSQRLDPPLTILPGPPPGVAPPDGGPVDGRFRRDTK